MVTVLVSAAYVKVRLLPLDDTLFGSDKTPATIILSTHSLLGCAPPADLRGTNEKSCSSKNNIAYLVDWNVVVDPVVVTVNFLR